MAPRTAVRWWWARCEKRAAQALQEAEAKERQAERLLDEAARLRLEA